MLSRLLAVIQAAVSGCQFFDLFPPFNDGRITPEVGVCECPERLSQPGLFCSWISVSSSFPSVTTMSQKSSLMQYR
jgi:hypothetical protein